MSSKQYIPFDALKGLKEELHKKEINIIERPIYSEEIYEELGIKLSKYHKRDLISLDYYHNGLIKHLEGNVSTIDFTLQFLQIGRAKVNFIDLIKIYDNINE